MMFSLPLALAETALLKLADFHLASTAVLAAALLATGMLRQPARRLAIAWASVAGVVILLALAMVPGWSIIHLGMPASGVDQGTVRLIGDSPSPVYGQPNAFIPPRHFDGVAPPIAPITAAAPATINWQALLTTSIAVAMLGGAALATAWLVWGAIAARRIVTQAEPAGAEATRSLAELAAPSPAPRLLVSDRLGTAVAIGLRRPTILLPRQMTASGASSDLRAVLAHELTHVRSGDLWLLAGLRLVVVVLWLNPLYWALRRRVRLDQETLADAAAAELAGRHAYAERLVSWARDIAAPPRLAGAAGLWEGPSQLRSRVAVLLDERFIVLRRCSTRWRAATGLLCGALALAASLVSLSPAAPDSQTAPPRANTVTPANGDSAAEATKRERGTATLSGKILVEGRNPSKVKGWLYSQSVSPGYSASATQGNFTDQFKCKVMSGTVSLKFFPDERYAPAVVGPFNMRDGDELKDIVIQLTPGDSAPLFVKDENNRAVAAARVVSYPLLNGNGTGPVRDQKTDSEGMVLLERLTPGALYGFTIESPGYQPLSVENVSIPQGGRPLQYTIKRARQAIGVVRWPDGSPCPDAKVMVLSQTESSGFSHSYTAGKELTTTNKEGQFTLDSLADGSRYLTVLEAPDSSRVLSIDFEAGKTGLEIDLPKRRDLLIRVRGDFDDLPKRRNGEPYVTIRQLFDQQWTTPTVSVSELFVAYVTLERTTGGAQAVFRGLVVDPRADAMGQSVEVLLGDDIASAKTVSIDSDPNHMGLVQFDLASASDDTLDVADNSSSVTYEPVSTPGDVWSHAARESTASITYEPVSTPGSVWAPASVDHPIARPDVPNAVRGECLDESGKPLAGVSVRLHATTVARRSNELLDETSTDAMGQFRFDKVVANAADLLKRGRSDSDERLFVFTAKRPGRVSKTYAETDYRIAAEGMQVGFVLPPAATVKGRVIDSKGQPVAGATVRVSNGILTLDDSVHAAVTDTEGRYVIADLPFNDYERLQRDRLVLRQQTDGNNSIATTQLYAIDAFIEATHPDYSAARSWLSRSPSEVNLELPPRADVVGRVVDDAGVGVEGLQVMSTYFPESPPPSRSNDWRPGQAVTDKQGYYRIKNLKPGVQQLQFHTQGDGLPKAIPAGPVRVTAEPLADSSGPTRAPDLRLTSGRVVRVQLVDETLGEPLRFSDPMLVNAYYTAAPDGAPQRAVSNMNLAVSADGVVECRVLPAAGSLMVHGLHREGDYESQSEWRPTERVALPSAEELGDAAVRYPVQWGVVSIGTLLNEAASLVEEKKMVEAIAFLTKQLKFKPRDVRLLMKRAEIADGIGQTVMAMADYESVLAVDPTNYGAMNNLAYLLLTASDETLHDAPRALRLATKANELFPRPHPEALHTLATAQKANGDIDGAIKTIEQAIAVAPERFRERMKELVESYRNQNGKATPK